MATRKRAVQGGDRDGFADSTSEPMLGPVTEQAGKTPFIVGIGASAGGLEALKTLFPGLPNDLGLSYVVVQHLSPNYRSMLGQLLAKDTAMPVMEVEQGATPSPNTVYLTPANRNVTLADGRFHLVKPAKEIYPKPSINTFFNSLAEECNEQSIGIILSGTGSDGAAGIYAIKAAGGFTFAQTPESAKYNGMPQSAIDTGSVDWVLPPDKIGAELALIVKSRGAVPVHVVDESAQGQLHRLLLKVRKRTKVDFSGYKKTTVWRRIARRLAATHMPNLDEYIEHCDNQPDELDRLCKDILISVTSFFRDREAFAALGKVVERIVASKPAGEEIRVWIPGCATGEEAYSIAILFAEATSRNGRQAVQIFATDIDLEAMARARRGQFATANMDNLPAALVKQYFIQRGERYEVVKPIREMVIFARQDLVQDPPFLRLDLIACRNVLIYFQTEMQAKILATFHYGLLPGAHLFLGKSESVAQQEKLFRVVDKDARIFRRQGPALRLPPIHSDIAHTADHSTHMLNNRGHWAEEALIRGAVRAFVPPCILVDADLNIRHIHGEAGRYLSVPDGHPSFDLGGLIRREFRAELQSLMRQASNKNLAAIGRVRHLQGMEKNLGVQMTVHPVNDGPAEHNFLVSFLRHDLPKRKVASEPLLESEPEHKAIEDELIATREHLQTVIEELETSNEEMQALNEELQSANEELQSTNEELEASNEELQSTNEELSTVNEELQVKTTTLEETYAELDNIQRSIDYPQIVVDIHLHVTRFNPAAARLFSLSPRTIGQSWRDVAMPGDLPRFESTILEAMRDRHSLSTVLSDETHHHALRVTPYIKDGEVVRGAILTLIDESDLFHAERQARESQRQMLAVMENASVVFAVKDTSGRYLYCNREYDKLTGLAHEAILGKTDAQLFPPSIAESLRLRDLEVMRLNNAYTQEEEVDFGGDIRTLLASRFPLSNEDGVTTSVCMQAVDITERKHAEEQLRLAARVFERAAEGLVVTDANGRILTVNDAFSRITGWRLDEVRGNTPAILRSGRQSPDFYREMWQRLADHGWWQGEIWNRRKNGEEYLEWLSINAVRDASGQLTNYVGTFSDIQVVKESKLKMEFLATHDELTGLPNRALFHDRLKLALARKERRPGILGVMFIDMDNFKIVNDTLGHDVGDALLKEAAARLQHHVRQGDTVARLGGDEFTVLMEETNKHQAAALAQRIIEAFSAPFRDTGRDLFITVSIGISIWPDDARDLQTLLKNADSAMYKVKTTGKHGFQFFSQEMAEATHKRLRVENNLRLAMSGDHFHLHYQPQVDIAQGGLIGAEALLRWQCPDGEAISPAEFIPVAEDTQLILPLTNRVLDMACHQVAAWRRKKIDVPRVSINLSGLCFIKGDLLAEIPRALKRHRLPTKALGVEITESVLMSHNGDVPRILSELKQMGLHISIDDFGTGYSSLAYLKHYPLDELKIDRRFVDGLAEDSDDRAIASAIIALAHSLGMRCTAEGVETRQQLAELRAKSCDHAQGYYIARPLPAEAFSAWLAAR